MLTRINKTMSDDKGIATEYVLLIVAVALALLLGFTFLAANVNKGFVVAGAEVAEQGSFTQANPDGITVNTN